MTSVRKATYLLSMVLSVSGCVLDSVRSHSTALEDVDNDNLHTLFINGKTTKRDVLTKLGPPINNQGDIATPLWLYHYRHEKKPLFLPKVGPLAGQDKMLSLRFDEKGVLVDAVLIDKAAN
ncbi:hypothetical protein J5069_18005 [Candidatus Symbiopectobacterium sp. NZEC127]|uniref:hypothetical protein n=1 Tax=Candidatus Symbiopectobacterium sp. NZEC127 TaxID=2820472 RepID=UPI0022267C89|nr:hypothetical protein [Candidatus Symbiopectobacterium sp. NZEC127]MCW2487795.1 hypothetical protein [Candidatus Symbiopectobacterium sp. NZEC127]